MVRKKNMTATSPTSALACLEQCQIQDEEHARMYSGCTQCWKQAMTTSEGPSIPKRYAIAALEGGAPIAYFSDLKTATNKAREAAVNTGKLYLVLESVAAFKPTTIPEECKIV